jgi:hypothetical protein
VIPPCFTSLVFFMISIQIFSGVLIRRFDLVLAFTAIHIKFNYNIVFLLCNVFETNNILFSIKPEVYFRTL